jgi:hypothetical protein
MKRVISVLVAALAAVTLTGVPAWADVSYSKSVTGTCRGHGWAATALFTARSSDGRRQAYGVTIKMTSFKGITDIYAVGSNHWDADVEFYHYSYPVTEQTAYTWNAPWGSKVNVFEGSSFSLSDGGDLCVVPDIYA